MTKSLPRKHRFSLSVLLQAFFVAVSLPFYGVHAWQAPGKSHTDWSQRLVQAFQFVSDFVFSKSSKEKPGGIHGELTVIGAGFSRTGTKSIQSALQQLGHRVRSMIENKGHPRRWIQAAIQYKQQSKDPSVFQDILEDIEALGYTSTLDCPMNLFALPLAKLRPEAKVIMSIRDSEEKWVESWGAINRIIFSRFVNRPWIWIMPDFDFIKRLLWILYDFDWTWASYPEQKSRPLPWFEVTHIQPDLVPQEGRQKWIDLHKRFQRELEESLDHDRLLIFNVKQSWKPLVEFLNLADKSLVEQPFPYVNDLCSLQVVRIAMDILAIGLPLWILSALYAVYRMSCALLNICRTAGKKKQD